MRHASPLLEVGELRVTLGGIVALDDVTLTVGAGTIVGLIGPNGAGKTTFIDTLAGFRSPAAGHLTFDGHDLGSLAPHERSRLGLVRTFQSLELFDDLSVRENLLVGSGVPTWRSMVSDLFRAGGANDPVVDEVLETLGLSHFAGVTPTALSNGQRHLVALGRALAARPRLVMLDEPAAGLDSAETEELRGVLERVLGMGTTVLLIDHDMSLVFGVCERVHVLDFGRIIARGTPAEVRADPMVIAAYLGTSGTPT